jgi:hypothetical protein
LLAGPGCDGGSSVDTECDEGLSLVDSDCDGERLSAGPGCDGGGSSVDTECDGDGLPAGAGCNRESSVDPDCNSVDNGRLEVAVSNSNDVDELDAALYEFSIVVPSVRYSAFVDDSSPGSIRFSDAAISNLPTSTRLTRTSFISRTATGAANTKLKIERIRRI